MNKIDINGLKEKSIYFENVSHFSEIENLKFPSNGFVLFLAANRANVKEQEIVLTAKKLITSGLTYICTFGPDCEKGHDIFDYANILWEQEHKTEFLVMSTWHAHETLEEALYFCILNAEPKDVKEIESSMVVLSVGNLEWSKTIQACLYNLPAFIKRMK